MKVNIVTGDVVSEEVSCYYQEAIRSGNEVDGFYELMYKVVRSEVLVSGDFNSYFFSDMGGFGGLDRFMGVFGTGQINNGRIRLLDWAVVKSYA